jgi:hypothetical protein
LEETVTDKDRAIPSGRAADASHSSPSVSTKGGIPIAVDDGPFGQPGICTLCGDDGPAVDEATELCEMCFEHTFGEDYE